MGDNHNDLHKGKMKDDDDIVLLVELRENDMPTHFLWAEKQLNEMVFKRWKR